MRLRFSPVGSLLLALGIILTYPQIPFSSILGVVLIIGGLLAPVIEKAPEDYRAPPLAWRVKKRDPLRDIAYATEQGQRAFSDDPEKRRWGRWQLIAMTDERRSPFVRRFCIVLFATYLEEYDEEVISRLEELAWNDPDHIVRSEAQKAKEKLGRLKIDHEITGNQCDQRPKLTGWGIASEIPE